MLNCLGKFALAAGKVQVPGVVPAMLAESLKQQIQELPPKKTYHKPNLKQKDDNDDKKKEKKDKKKKEKKEKKEKKKDDKK